MYKGFIVNIIIASIFFLSGKYSLVFGQLSSENDITDYTIPGQVGSSDIDFDAHTVDVIMPFSTNLSGLVADFTLSLQASAEVGTTPQVSEFTPNDFSAGPVIYTITAEDGTPQDWSVSVINAANSANDITDYTIPGQVGSSDIDFNAHTVDVIMPFSTNLSGLVADFTLSLQASAEVGTTPQVSEFTPNDFSAGPVIYTITAEDGTPQDWSVSVINAANSANDITDYTIPGQVGSSDIDFDAHTVDVIMPFSTNLSSLVADFTLSLQASAEVGTTPQVSESTPNDFSAGPVIYTITAEDGTPQNWSVSVINAANSANDITDYTIPGQVGSSDIDFNAHTVDVIMPFSTNLSSLVADFTLSLQASAEVGTTPQVSEFTPNDFSAGPVIYTITAEDGTPQDWSVSVINAANSANDITDYTIPGQVGSSDIDFDAHTVDVIMLFGTNLSGLVADFTLSLQASAEVGTTPQVSEFTPNDFSAGPVIYTITAEDGTPQDWSVSVINAANSANDITDYTIPGQVGSSDIDFDAHTVDVIMPFSTNLSGLVADFTLSLQASAEVGTTPQVSEFTPNDFSAGPVIYTITAEDGTPQDWSVSVINAANSANDITDYTIPGQVGSSDIDFNAHTVDVIMPFSTNLSGLVADFTLSLQASAEVGTTPQVSESTPNDFSAGPVIYTITAEDGTPQDWSVSVINAANSANDITDYTIPGQVGSSDIDFDAHTVDVIMPFSTNLSGLVADFTLSLQASAEVGTTPQVSEFTPNDFSAGPVIYTITAEDGTPQDWSVSVINAANSANDITDYTIPGQVGSSDIDFDAHTVDVIMLFGTNLSGLVADFTLSLQASAEVGTTPQVSEFTPNDFSAGPVIYTITAEDGTPQDWSVSVTAPNSANDITDYTIPGQVGSSDIDFDAHTVDVIMPFSTNLSSLVADFTLSLQASAEVGTTPQVSESTPNDFSAGPVIYTITAEDGTPQDWSVSVINAANSENDILTYSLPGLTGPANINNGNHTVLVEVPFGTDVTNLVATFTLSLQASASVGPTTQVSGATPNNFSSPVIYAVQAGDGTIENWTVSVIFAPNTETDILSFSVDGYNGLVNSGNHTVNIIVPYGTNISDMTATFTLSPEAEARVVGSLQESGVSSLNFSSPITYSIAAGDAITFQDWIVSINFAPNTATDIESYSFPEQTGDAVVNSSTHTVYVQVAYGTSLSNLIASFELSYGATTYVGGTQQTSGVTTNNFSATLVYTVVAEDSVSVQNWTVDVSVEPNSATDIISFSLSGEVGNSIVNSGSHSVSVVMPYGSDISNMVATFTLSEGATAGINGVSQTSGVTSNDFTNTLIYSVTAENGTDTQDWIIQVSIAPNTSTAILLFSFNEISRPSIIDFDTHAVDVLVVYGTEVSSLVPTFILSEGAEASIAGISQESGITPNNYSDPVTYTITAEDGITTQNWIVTVRSAQNTKADILDYSFAEETGPATIDSISKEIEIEVAYGTDITNLVATFNLSDNATAKVGVDTQNSGVTENDFTDIVTYVVTSEDESISNIWNVSVSKAENSSAEILSFSLPGQTKEAEIDPLNHTIEVEVEYGTDLSELIASFTLSEQAVAYIGPVRQESDISANDYTTTITFIVHAGDGITEQDWIIIVTYIPPSTETEILSYSFPELVYIKFDTTENRHHIYVQVNKEAEIDRLIASFELSKGAYAMVDGIIQESGITANNFTDTVTYVVMAQDSTTFQNWTVVVEPDLGFVYNRRPIEFPVSHQRVTTSAKLPLNQSFDEVNFYYRKFEEQNWNTPLQVSRNQEIFSMDITRDLIGNLGMFYYFEAVDSLGNGISLPETQMILHYDTVFAEIPDMKFGETVNQYQIISIPLELQNSNAEAVFDELDEYNVKYWRLFHHNGESNIEYKNGFTDIIPGLGYWLITRDSTTIETGEGRTVRLDSVSRAYSFNLNPGWNQIGNPFDMEIRWDDVIFDNRNLNIGRVRLYTEDSLSEGNIIPRFRGGFVFLEGEDSISVQLRPEIISFLTRRQEYVDQDRFNSLDQTSWIAGLKISNGSFTNTLSGIGMHPDAMEGKDWHDEVLMPVPKEIIPFELAFNHPDEKYDKFSLDVIPTNDNYIWEFEVNSFMEGQELMINWDNKHFGDNDLNLILNHKAIEKLIDMKEVNSYSFNASGTNQFRIIFGDNSFINNHIIPESITFGHSYPNPFRNNVTMPFTLPENDADYKVTINVYDLTGTLIKQLVDDYYQPGYYTVSWNSLESSKTIRNGIYIIRMSIQSDKINTSLIRKVLKY